MGDRLPPLSEVILRIVAYVANTHVLTWLFDKAFGRRNIVTWFDIEITMRQ